MNPLRILIVDDEALGRERVRSMLESRREEMEVHEANDGREAVRLLSTEPFDLVVLDVQMPYETGFDVVRKLGVERMPPIIFVTAYDAYALQAFEVHALDYLLKPFEPQRFHEALDRVLDYIAQSNRGDLASRVQLFLDDMVEARKPLTRLMIKTQQHIEFVTAEDVDWIEAAGNYASLHIGKKSYLIRQTMKSLESRLDPDRFLRIHRSTIVNIDRVKDLHVMFSGDYEVRLLDGTKLTLSRNYRHALDRFA